MIPRQFFKLIIAACIIVAFSPVNGFSASTSATVGVSINVGTSISLDLDLRIIDFERMVPGETKEDIPSQGLLVTCKSNNPSTPWFLKISNTGPLTYGPYTIDDSDLFWYGWSEGSGTWYGRGNDNLSPTPVLVYRSPDSGVNLPDGTNCHLKFKLAIPKDQEPGPYSTTIQFTMTE